VFKNGIGTLEAFAFISTDNSYWRCHQDKENAQ